MAHLLHQLHLDHPTLEDPYFFLWVTGLTLVLSALVVYAYAAALAT